jgi:hypothetical protein
MFGIIALSDNGSAILPHSSREDNILADTIFYTPGYISFGISVMENRMENGKKEADDLWFRPVPFGGSIELTMVSKKMGRSKNCFAPFPQLVNCSYSYGAQEPSSLL